MVQKRPLLVAVSRIRVRRSLVRGVATAGLACWVLLGPMTTRAEAGVPILVGSGTYIVRVGPLPADLATRIRKETGKEMALGYKYSYRSLFLLDLWTWNGEYCLYQANSYIPVTLAQATEFMKGTGKTIEPPFQYRYPLGLLFLGALACFMLVTLAVRTLLAKLRPVEEATSFAGR